MEESLTCINEDKETNAVSCDVNGIVLRPVVKERVVQQRLICDCDLHSITVFLDKAEVCRIIPIQIGPDQSLELQLSQLSPFIDKDSIRIEAREAPIIIQDVTFQTKSQELDSTMAEEKKLTVIKLEKEENRNKESLQAKLSRLTKQRTVLEKFADRLIRSQDIEKINNSVEINTETLNQVSKSPALDAFDPKHMETLNGFFEMYEKQAEKLDEQIFNTKEDLIKSDLLLQSYEKRQWDLEEVKDRMKSRELSILIEGKEQIKTDIFLYYVVNQCSWRPSYDIRIINNESKMKITYHAIVQQNTKEDWSEVQEMNISTVQPPVGGSVPEIGVQKVTFKSVTDSKGVQSPTLIAKSRKNRTKSIIVPSTPLASDSVLETSLYNYNQAEELSTKDQGSSNLSTPGRCQKGQRKCDIPSAQYSVSRPPGLISSGSEPVKIVIAYIDLLPTFEYTSVPKRAPYAYLKANATNSSDYAILSGEANVYVDSSFVGKTELKTVAPGEEFSCQLGADHRIQISYHPMYKYREGSLPIAKTISLAFKQAIEIMNNHSKPIKMTLMDQLPIANEDKIKVTLQEPTIKHPEKYDKSKPIRLSKNNQVEWDLEIGSGEKKEIILKYTVEYPAGECLDLISE